MENEHAITKRPLDFGERERPTWQRGIPWDEERWAKFAVYDEALDMARMFVQTYAHTPPDFAVVPEVVADARASLALSTDWITRVPTDVRWYLAVQNGMREEHVDEALAWGIEEGPGYQGLFVGGTREWKFRTTPAWVRFAHDHGLKVHVGRVSSRKRLTWCELVGVDSVDSSAFERFVDSSRVSRARTLAHGQRRLGAA